MHRILARPLLATLALCLSLGATAAQGSYLNLGPAGDFNLFVFNDNTQSGSDSEGRVAVGRDALFGSFTVGSSMGNNTDNLIVGRNLTNTYTTQRGGVLVGGNLTWETPTILGRVAVNGNANFTGWGSVTGPVNVVGTYSAPNYFPPNQNTGPNPFPFDFAEVESYLVSQAAYLATIPTNGEVKINQGNGAITLTALNPADSYISFNLTGAEMADATSGGLTINAPAGSTVVVNVTGPVSSMVSFGINLNGVDKQHVLYNFHDAMNLTLDQIGVMGTILAPLASVNFAGGAIDGTIIAKNLSGPGESHLYLFQGDLPLQPVPEPATVALGAMGLAALVTVRLRRKRSA
jgi:choice-of-anchor A domain-containing protein